MKKLFLISALLMAINIIGQIKSEKVDGLKIVNQQTASKNDTIIEVVYKNQFLNENKPAIYLNGKHTDESILRSLHPNKIETINVEKENIEIENVKYYGKIYIVTRSSYKPKLISLNNFKLKYTNLKEGSTIFKIDEEIINADYENYLVDENFILKIIVEKFENKNEKLNVNFVNLITKSDENIKKTKEIRLRGKDEFGVNK